jgi:GDPmannose 4,6-dehydratase
VTRKVTLGVAQALKDPSFRLKLGNLDAERDWGYAPDFVRGFWMALQQEKADDYIFATNESHSVRELCEEAFSVAGLNWEEYVEVDRFFMRPAEVDSLCGDYSETEAKLGWTPTVRFKELVRIMVESDCKLLGVEDKLKHNSEETLPRFMEEENDG